MGFYGEDDTFCEVSAREALRISPLNGPKRMRFDEPSTSCAEERQWSAFGDSLAELDSLDTNGEMERDPQESIVLRRIGLGENPCRALRRYMEKVAKGVKPNPWVSKVQSEKTLRKTLRRFMLGIVVLACEDQGVEDCELEQSHRNAFKSIDYLNEEIIQSLEVLGNFSSEQMRCARNNCQKVPDCSRSTETHDSVNYLIVEGGRYSRRLEMPEHPESNSKVREILKNNRFINSDDVIDELPSLLIRSLVHFYMARYFCLWAFGDTELWKKNGFTLFQALFGSQSY
ncbi:unnamed protein product [Angiostrongylus costaricensis]|uniref:RYDR_ITPR domain-containing protein n=1 Tax=Angiostrongylus costaricensis TaxID=334426 RepID=A0A0R3PPL9_ANGCS|nr:unnamed protein product [Angiostrongylus costaricensis]